MSLSMCPLLAIDDDNAVAKSAVHDAELTVIHEVFLGDGLIDIEAQFPEVLELQGLLHRHGTAEDEAVVVGVGEEDRVSLHYFLHDETLTESLGVIALDILRMASGLELYMLIAYVAVSFLCVDAHAKPSKGKSE